LDLIIGFLLGQAMHMPPPPADPLRLVIGIAIISTIVIVATLFCRDMGQERITDTSKALWGLSFYLIPIVSWLGYYFIVKKGISTSKTSK